MMPDEGSDAGASAPSPPRDARQASRRADPDPALRLRQAARRFGLTERAIRHYEDMGLVASGRTRANVRCFDRQACARLAWIARLRRYNVPLRQIREVLRALDAGECGTLRALEKLALRREQLLEEICGLETELATLKASVDAWPDGGARQVRA